MTNAFLAKLAAAAVLSRADARPRVDVVALVTFRAEI
jgi:hypothetical protein